MVLISIRIDLALSVVVWITSIVTLIQLIPITVSGLGVREGALFFLLSKYDIPGSEALALAFLLFAIATMISLVGGILEARNYFYKTDIS